MTHTPLLSICAPAYDEEECIEATVGSWLAMLDDAGIEGEVVVANDGSRDRTAALRPSEAIADLAVEFDLILQMGDQHAELGAPVTHMILANHSVTLGFENPCQRITHDRRAQVADMHLFGKVR